jgi:hypothetical protein
VAARLARRHVARAAWANAGMWVPPSPSPARRLAGDGGGACRLSRCRQGDVAHACRIWQWRQDPPLRTAVDGSRRAGVGCGSTPMPASAQAARAMCRLARRAATRRGSFLTIFSAGGLF